jgi:hypothetical protein
MKFRFREQKSLGTFVLKIRFEAIFMIKFVFQNTLFTLFFFNFQTKSGTYLLFQWSAVSDVFADGCSVRAA